MATESRDASTALTVPTANAEPALNNLRRMLEEEPFRVHFFQAVRMLQKMESERKPVGYFVTPQGETIRFSARTSLAFPPSELHEAKIASVLEALAMLPLYASTANFRSAHAD